MKEEWDPVIGNLCFVRYSLPILYLILATALQVDFTSHPIHCLRHCSIELPQVFKRYHNVSGQGQLCRLTELKMLPLADTQIQSQAWPLCSRKAL